MPANILFNLIDGESNPLVGSKVILRPFSPPYSSGSVLTTNSPVTLYSDNSGSALFPNVISGLYKISVSPANANNPILRNNLQNFANTVFYIEVPPSASGTINGINCLATQPTNTGTSSWTGSIDNPAFIAYTIDAANATFIPFGGSIQNAISASLSLFAISASWADRSGHAYSADSASWAPSAATSDSASWASQSLSASYLRNDQVLHIQSNLGRITARSYLDSEYSSLGNITMSALGGFALIQSDADIILQSGIDGGGIQLNPVGDIFVNGTLSIDEFGTASIAKKAISASWAPDNESGFATSASWASSSISASLAQTASSVYNANNVSIRAGGNTNIRSNFDTNITASGKVNIASIGDYVNIFSDGGIFLNVGIDGDRVTIVDPVLLQVGGICGVGDTNPIINVNQRTLHNSWSVDYLQGSGSLANSVVNVGSSKLVSTIPTLDWANRQLIGAWSGSIQGTSSYSTTASYALNGGSTLANVICIESSSYVLLSPPVDGTLYFVYKFNFRTTEAGDQRITEDGFDRITE